jgi:hypothetical protein
VRGATLGQTIQFGAALPVAFAPFISLIGDYYEMGSILVSRVAVNLNQSLPLERWRSDDIFRLAHDLSSSAGGMTIGDVMGTGASLMLGTLLAFGTYLLGTAWSDVVLGRKSARRESDD